MAAGGRKTNEVPGLAAYGLCLAGIEQPGGSLRAPDDWERWTVERVVEAGSELAGDDMTVWEDRALIPMPELGRIAVERAARTIVFTTVRPISDLALLHPGLVPAAAVISAWHGRACLHSAAIVAGGRVWGLLGERGDGKSTTAALLAERGYELFTDDVLVAERTRCFAGPAVVDLREDASARVGGDYLGRIGRRERWRKSLERHTVEAPLGGFVELAWSADGGALEELPLTRRLELLGHHASMPMAGAQLLALASQPAFRLSRPRDLEGAGAPLDRLAEAIGPP